MKKIILLLLAASLTAVSCKKDNDPIKENSNKDLPGHIPGMGETAGDLTGTPFIFPEKIEIKGGLKGDIYLAPATDYCQTTGSGAFVLITMELVNHLQKDTLLILPAGLTFLADQIEDQHGILIQKTPIHLAKGETCKTLLYLYCINARKDGSSRHSNYTFGPVTDAAPLTELIQLLQKKKIDLKSHELQQIVWKITDYEGLSREDRDYILSLDNR